jgi:chlorite dismutase
MDWMHEARIASINTYVRQLAEMVREQEKIMEHIGCCELGQDYDVELKLVKELTELLKKINANLQDLTETVQQLSEEVGGDERTAMD